MSESLNRISLGNSGGGGDIDSKDNASPSESSGDNLFISFKSSKRTMPCLNPRRLGWITWSLLANNPISQKIYLILSMFEFVWLLYYELSLVFSATSSLNESEDGSGNND